MISSETSNLAFVKYTMLADLGWNRSSAFVIPGLFLISCLNGEFLLWPEVLVDRVSLSVHLLSTCFFLISFLAAALMEFLTGFLGSNGHPPAPGFPQGQQVEKALHDVHEE